MTAPETATREEFERLLRDYVGTERALSAAPDAPGNYHTRLDYLKQRDAARAELLRYEERLRGERDEAQGRAARWEMFERQARGEANRLSTVLADQRKMEVAFAPGTRTERLEKALRSALAAEAGWRPKAERALGVPTSAADGGAK